MKHYDVIIVGAGPAGLRCAEMLAAANRKTLLLEKKPETGPKVCAGGLTRKTLRLMSVPGNLFELKISEAKITGPKSVFTVQRENEPFVFMVNRKSFGQWQEQKLNGTTVEVRHNALVTDIQKTYVEVNRQERLGYSWLVGADGSTSKVRRFLRLPVEKQLVTLQYLIPAKETRFEIHMDNRYFRSGYGWIFPHSDHWAVGCLADPRHVPVKILKSGFRRWLRKEGFDLNGAVYQSFPVNYDYRGLRFGNVFLAGDAAGLASGLTGEGIYAALVSGEEIARMILQPGYRSEKFDRLLHYKKVQDNFLRLLHVAGPARQMIFRAILYLLNNKRFNRRVTRGFS
jgi:geranylgeranyl reductase family protein